MYILAFDLRAKFRLLARSAGVIKPGPRSVAGLFTTIILPSFLLFVLHQPAVSYLDLCSPLFVSPRGEKIHVTSIARVTAPIMRPAAATTRPDSTKNHLSSVFRLANSSRRKESETDPGGRAGRKGGSMATETRRGFRRDETGGVPTLRMHPRNPFLAYIHFRCDKVERARKRERERVSE